MKSQNVIVKCEHGVRLRIALAGFKHRQKIRCPGQHSVRRPQNRCARSSNCWTLDAAQGTSLEIEVQDADDGADGRASGTGPCF